MYFLFIDESGDHNLIKINKDYPVFILAGCIVKSSYYNPNFVKEVNVYKSKLFNTKRIILHTADITRNKNGFEKLKEHSFRKIFYEETNSLIKSLDLTLIACIVDKYKYLEKHGELASDPYEISLKCLLERFYYFLKENNSKGEIYAESRGNILDSKLELSYMDIKLSGITHKTGKIRGADIRRRFLDFKFLNKKRNVSGLQIADLCATPVGRKYIGKRTHEDYKIIKSKFRKRNNEIYGYGLIMIPEECYPKK